MINQIGFAAAMLVATVQAVPCKALAMSGGSNNGAWEIGVLWGLSHYGNPEDYYWDVVSGVSAGAINTAGTAGWAPEEVLEMTEYLSEAWNGLTSRDVWNMRPDIIRVPFGEKSLLDDSPLLETIRDIMSVRSDYGRRVSVGTVDLDRGEYVEFNQKTTSYYDFGQASMSSGSIPGAFPPQPFAGGHYVDGGTCWNINIDSALNQCYEMGATTEEITLDVLIVGFMRPHHTDEIGNSIANFQTKRQIYSYYNNMNSIDAEMRAYDGINMRFYFQEHGTGCPNISQLDFNGEDTWCLQEAGRRDAATALEMGQEHIQSSLRQWFDDKDLQKQYPYAYDYILASY